MIKFFHHFTYLRIFCLRLVMRNYFSLSISLLQSFSPISLPNFTNHFFHLYFNLFELYICYIFYFHLNFIPSHFVVNEIYDEDVRTGLHKTKLRTEQNSYKKDLFVRIHNSKTVDYFRSKSSQITKKWFIIYSEILL